MLLSCLAILLGVAVIIFIVLTLGMEESPGSRAQKGSMKSCVVEFLLSSVSQRPSKDRMEGGSLYCNWAPICTAERKENIDLKMGEKHKRQAISTFVAMSHPVNPQTQEQRTKHSTFHLHSARQRILQRKWNGSCSCWCAEVCALPPQTKIIVWHYILLIKKGTASLKMEEIGIP